MNKFLSTYLVTLKEETDYNYSWTERNQCLFRSIAHLANEVVKLNGTVSVNKYFDSNYMDYHCFIHIKEEHLGEIKKLKSVSEIAKHEKAGVR